MEGAFIMKKLLVGIAFILISTLVVMFHIEKDEKEATKQINSLFERIFVEGDNDYNEMIEGQTEDIERKLYEKYSYYFTLNGWDMAAKGRIVTLGIKQYQQMHSIPQDIKMKITERKDMENWYLCQIELLYENENVYSYIFNVQCVKQGNEWLIDYIAK